MYRFRYRVSPMSSEMPSSEMPSSEISTTTKIGLSLLGLLVVAGIGLLIYFLTKKSSSTSPSPTPGYLPNRQTPQPTRNNNPPQPTHNNNPPQPTHNNNPPQPTHNNPPQPTHNNNPPQPTHNNNPPQTHGNMCIQLGYESIGPNGVGSCTQDGLNYFRDIVNDPSNQNYFCTNSDMSTNITNCKTQCNQGDLSGLQKGLECQQCCSKSCEELTTCSGSGTGKRGTPAAPPQDGGMSCDTCKTICRMQGVSGANCTCLSNCE